MEKNSGKLGKGLGALLGGNDIPIPMHSAARIKSDTNSLIRIDSIEVNPFQPRIDFDESELLELSQSIKTFGLIQPITVRPIENGKYQLISGERRLRACKLAGLNEVPAYVRTADDLLSLQMALVENIQRKDLNAIEVAVCFQRLMDECNFNQEELSDKVGKQRSTVTNYLRLLKLYRPAQIAVRDNKISMGHARTLVMIENEAAQTKMVNEIIQNGLSVRQTETTVKNYLAQTAKTPKTKIKIKLSDELVDFKTKFSQKLGTKINIQKELSGKGKILIQFDSEEKLQKIIALLR